MIKKVPCGERITGVEVADFLLEKAIELKLKITLIFSQTGLSQKKEIEKYLTQRGVNNFEVLGVFPQAILKAIGKQSSKKPPKKLTLFWLVWAHLGKRNLFSNSKKGLPLCCGRRCGRNF